VRWQDELIEAINQKGNAMKSYKVVKLEKERENGNRLAQIVRISDGQEMLYSYNGDRNEPTWLARANRLAKEMNEKTEEGVFYINRAAENS